jgi:aromatic amino acid aminotransferase I
MVNDKTSPPQKELPRTEEQKAAIYFRGTFATVTPDRIDEAMKRFAQHIEREFRPAH